MSKYQEDDTQKILHKNDEVDHKLKDKKTGKAKTIWCPIFKPENLGTNMTIDEKNIGNECYTIIANKDTGKIFLMIMTTKSKLICKVLSKLSLKYRLKVKVITKDLAEGYDWVARTMFPNAKKVADKFHVLKLGFQALQDVRVRFRQEILTQEREKNNKLKTSKNKNIQNSKNINDNAKLNYFKNKFENGETPKELLARSRYLLFKKEKDWSDSQLERAKILFYNFPEINAAYEFINAFRDFYEKDNLQDAKKSLDAIYLDAKSSKTPEIINFVSTLKRHEAVILNYFITKQTNAFAESLNAKIQRFVISSFGFRDRQFFHFRIKEHFS